MHNRAIRQEVEDRIRRLAGQPDAIPGRLAELDREWDIERALEANAATLALIGTLLALASPWFLLLPGLVTAFLLQHALQGWCPPVNLFRRFGLRTQTEIEAERYALMALRGDFAEAAVADPGGERAERVLALVADRLPPRS